MRAWNHLIAVAVILLMAGCAPDHSDPVQQSEASSQETSSQETAQDGSQTEPTAAVSDHHVTIAVAEEEPQDDSPGLAVGAKAPEFDLKDQDGQDRSLADLLKSGQVALVYYRSADW